MTVSAHTTVTLHCDHCDRRQVLTGYSKKDADRAARHAGWMFDYHRDHALCVRCRPREHVIARRTPRQDAIEAEYGRPFWELVEELAMKHEGNMAAVARQINYRERSFRALVERHQRRYMFEQAKTKSRIYISWAAR